MSTTSTSLKTLTVNRAQGDLELAVELEANHVINTWSKGTMFRGFENMLKGRGARDGLVLTPRVCGICGIAQLYAAVKALEMLSNASPPNNAVLIRNIVLLAEQIQNDIRHALLIFNKDFLNRTYRGKPLYEEAVQRYESFKGSSSIETIRMSKKILEIVAILGGQWPHTSFMVPGGIAGKPSFNDLQSCRYIVDLFRHWYEKRILGCTIERWSEVENEQELQRWMNEQQNHFNSDLGFFIRYSHMIELHKLGQSYPNFVSFGQDQLPQTAGTCKAAQICFSSGALFDGKKLPFNQEKVAEHVTYSHFKDYLGGKHPFNGETQPHVTRYENVKYSFTKAPRYDSLPAETGPLAQLLVGEHPLISDLVTRYGSNAYIRQLARLLRPSLYLAVMGCWLDSIEPEAPCYQQPSQLEEGKGYGLIEASRGVLGHWVKLTGGKIDTYQIITPTAWNGSPRDVNGKRGPWEEAVLGTTVNDPENPVEVEHIIRSFDPCQVCSVHTARRK